MLKIFKGSSYSDTMIKKDKYIIDFYFNDMEYPIVTTKH